MSAPADPWASLRALTAARIALGRVGDGLPTAPLLDFQMAHARARDAVHEALDGPALTRAIADAVPGATVVEVRSAAPDRATYLRRPDLGRQLAAGEADRLKAAATGAGAPDVVFVLGDGLSARAVAAHGPATLKAAIGHLNGAGGGGGGEGDDGWRVGPVVVAHEARVALADPVGEAFAARLTVMLIGERPGLSAADSLGAYLTWDPRPGRQNAARNCVSNIRPGGLDPAAAGAKIAWLMNAARALGATGVPLKDESGDILPGTEGMREVEG